MTAKQFIQIAKALHLSIEEVSDMLDGGRNREWPTPKQIRAQAALRIKAISKGKFKNSEEIRSKLARHSGKGKA